ncbi:phosphatase PAP2 family protein, partial [Roseburia faecis]|nr:phosphatase PAP2 family protein [Roseburia faecis]
NATVVLWISLLPTFVKSLVGKKRLLEVTAIVWIVLVMISRIVMGAHFSTDVIVGMLISMMLFFFLKYKFMPQNSENTMLL